MKKHYLCPCCGSDLIDRKTEIKEHKDSENNIDFNYIDVINKCYSCEQEGDFFFEGDLHFELALYIAQLRKINDLSAINPSYKIKNFN